MGGAGVQLWAQSNLGHMHAQLLENLRAMFVRHTAAAHLSTFARIQAQTFAKSYKTVEVQAKPISAFSHTLVCDA